MSAMTIDLVNQMWWASAGSGRLDLLKILLLFQLLVQHSAGQKIRVISSSRSFISLDESFIMKSFSSFNHQSECKYISEFGNQ